jgi:3-hydroxyacyl-CoA dehydrogenase/enoyl-CoA hydratase/3-hydroxybutyryl-CoA epimerase
MYAYSDSCWRPALDADGFLWLGLDCPGKAVNVLGRGVLEALDKVLAEVAADPPAGLVVHSLKSGGFIAGADIHEFTELRDRREALRLMALGQGVFARLEALPVPTLAAIHGYCLGGGLELALACRYRVVEDGPRTRLGLPEVKLGIHPGFGGTLRSLRLLGPPAALDLMLTARAVDGRRALRLGLVDACVPARQLRNAARGLLLQAPAPHRPARHARLSDWRPLRGMIRTRVRRRLQEKVNPDHYPAPYALLDLWHRYGTDARRLLPAEAESVASLLEGRTAPNLVRVFLLRERLQALARNDVDPPRHLHLIGAGAMGGDIAARAALSGLSVSLEDRRMDAVGRAVARARALFAKRLRDPRQARAAMDRLIPDPHGSGAAKADVVLEAVFEDVQIKQELLRSLEPRLKPDAWLATNTSSIPLETLAEALHHPQRLVGMHFFNPVEKMPLVEVIRGKDSSALVLRRALALARALDRLPLPVRSSPGFLVNRLLMTYLLEAMRLLEEGTGPSIVDAAATDFGMPVGPLELADRVGLDICLSTAETFAAGFGIDPPQVLRERVERGDLGRKSGRGFYRWEADRPMAPHGGRALQGTGKDLGDRLILPVLNEAVRTLREGVVEDPDLLDAGMVFGAGFAPFRGGPMRYIEQTGRKPLVKRLRALERRVGGRFAPDPGWEVPSATASCDIGSRAARPAQRAEDTAWLGCSPAPEKRRRT